MTNDNVKFEEMEIKEKTGKGRKIAIAFGLIAAGIYGYKFGESVTNHRGELGLKKLFEKDPTLKEHMANVMGDCFKDRLLKS